VLKIITKGFRYNFFTLKLLYLIFCWKIIKGANIRGFLLLHVKCLCIKIHSTPCIIYQGTDILPEFFSSSPDTSVCSKKILILSDKHECWTASKNFWRYISVWRYIRKRIARKSFSLGKLYRKFSLGKIVIGCYSNNSEL
jgi:hypothetical protein